MNKDIWGGHDATFHAWYIVGLPLMLSAQEFRGCIGKRKELIMCRDRAGLREPDTWRQSSAQNKEFCASVSSNARKSAENFPSQEVF